MTNLWDTIVNDYLGRLVSPDWGALVGLIPVALLGVVALYVGWIAVRFATAGPRTRGGPVVPRTPEGLHMPGPSLSPLYLAGAATVLFLGLAAMNADPSILVLDAIPLRDLGPWIFALGVLLTIGAGLYWGREVMRESGRPAGRGVVAGSFDAKEPPAGVHIPGPSFRPLLIAVAATVLFLGLGLATNQQIVEDYGDVGLPILVAGLVMIAVVGIQWLRDAVVEYRLAVRADRTGHLENPPAPRFPWITLGFFALLFVGAVVVGTGAFPPGSGGGTAGGGGAPSTAAPGGGTDATSAPAGTPGTGDGAGTTTAPGGGGGSPSGPVIKIVALNIAFDVSEITAPADAPFTISFDNQDAGIPHNVAIHKGSPTGEVVFMGEIFTGVAQKDYAVPALPAGTYAFVCTVHPNMVGTLTVQ
jgi:plastocyanin